MTRMVLSSDVLLDSLPALQVRYYSLTCAPEEHPEECHVAFSVVSFTTEGGFLRKGVATNWLDRVAGPTALLTSNAAQPVQLPVFLKRGGQFHPPADCVGAHMIMVRLPTCSSVFPSWRMYDPNP